MDDELLYNELYEKTKDCGRTQFVKKKKKKEKENQQLKADYGNKAQVERDILLQERQELIDYLKEKEKEYKKLYNQSCDIVAFDRYESLIILCQEILFKIEKR